MSKIMSMLLGLVIGVSGTLLVIHLPDLLSNKDKPEKGSSIQRVIGLDDRENRLSNVYEDYFVIGLDDIEYFYDREGFTLGIRIKDEIIVEMITKLDRWHNGRISKNYGRRGLDFIYYVLSSTNGSKHPMPDVAIKDVTNNTGYVQLPFAGGTSYPRLAYENNSWQVSNNEYKVVKVPEDNLIKEYRYSLFGVSEEVLGIVHEDGPDYIYASGFTSALALDLKSASNPGSEYPLPPDPVKEGHRFVGWYVDEAMTIAYEGSPIYEETVLYAKFEVDSYTVSFVTNGANEVAPITVAWDNKIQEPIVDKEGHDFVGWYSDSSYSTRFDFSISIKSDITLYAKFNIKMFTVKFMVESEIYFTLEVAWGTTLEQIKKMLYASNVFIEDRVFLDVDYTQGVVDNYEIVQNRVLFVTKAPLGFFAMAGRGLDIFFATWWMWLSAIVSIGMIVFLFIRGKRNS